MTPTVTLVLNPSSIGENGGVSTVTATLSGASSEVDGDGFCDGGVPCGFGGLHAESGTALTIAAGSTTSTGVVTVTAVDNVVDAPDKTVTVSAR